MANSVLKKCAFGLLLLICFGPQSWGKIASDANIPTDPAQAQAAIITVSGLIDDGLYHSIKRRANDALAAGADYLIFEINTYGGLVLSADDISKYLLDLAQKAHTVAYVRTQAISAGSMISVSCQDIIMRQNTTIGDCAPIEMGGGKLEGVEREKMESFIRAVFKRAAEANNYPPVLLEAMVSRHLKVYRARDIHTGKFEFYETDKLPADYNDFAPGSKELIVSENELLTLTAKQAGEYGVARAIVSDVNGVLAFLANRDNLYFVGRPPRMAPNWSEQLVRLLNHPSVTSILFMAGLLGIYMELKTPGLGLPGLVAVICFAILFGSKYLTGLATWWEIAVFTLGVVLLFLEVFVIPGFGIAGVAGIFCILVGLFGMLIPNRPDQLPWPNYDFGDVQWHLFQRGALALCFGFVGFIVLAYIIGKFLPKTSVFRGLVLSPAQPGDRMPVDLTSPVKAAVKAVSVGDNGVALTKLRPAGQVKIAEAVIDAVAEGVFIEKDDNVVITEIHGNRVVVKKNKL